MALMKYWDGTSWLDLVDNTQINKPTLNSPILVSSREKINILNSSVSGTIDFDTLSQSVLYFTQNSTSNFVLNFRGNISNTLNNSMDIGSSLTLALLATNGSTARYNTSIQIDGVAQVAKWQSGVAPTTGNANSVDIYNYTIIKTGTNQFTVFALLSRFG